MKNHRMFIDTIRKSGQSELMRISLTPETDAEKNLLKENKDTETIELYYHQAVEEIKDGEYVLLSVEDMSHWPNAALVNVQKVG